ncbi:MAG: efflux RND transporter periplasmic adaptor subunit [Spirochaetaceae bacterium]|nr:efflux RND transporter periplasmic adaptor subunit [Spirochaetaceae bacterium]
MPLKKYTALCAAFAVTAALAVVVLLLNRAHPKTDDAYLIADTIEIAPEVSGRIIEMNISDNQYVSEGEVLFRIEPEFYQLMRDKAAAAEKQARNTYNRMLPLSGRNGSVSAEQMDIYITALSLAEADLALAERALAHTVVQAPFDGLVSGLRGTAGMLAAVGVPVFTLIDTREWFVLANFRETELSDIHPGSEASVWLMSAPDRRFDAEIDSIAWGVQPSDAIVILGQMPLTRRSMEWVRIAQRFPVKLRVKNPDHNLFRAGASAVAEIGERKR